MKMPTDGPERRRPAGWSLALINGYSFGNAGGTPALPGYFRNSMLNTARRRVYLPRHGCALIKD